MKTFRELLIAEFSPYGALSPSQVAQLEQHYELLLRWNEVLNLTRMSALDEAVRFHYCESLFLGLALPAGAQRVVDIGSGAGFPGVPLAILRPELSVDLMESHKRKAVFLREASRNLPNVRVLACRAEECREGYDWMVARAVRPEELVSLTVAANLALLLSEADLTRVSASFRVQRVPWGRQRVLIVGQVPRETSIRS